MTKYEFTYVIKSWPVHHKRNIDICMQVAIGNSYKSVGKNFNISGSRVSQIYRVMMGKICQQLFFIPYHEAVNNKLYYNHPDRLIIIKEYNKFYDQKIINYQ